MENIKFIVGQTSSINRYKNTRSKLLKCANIYFNRQCLAKKIIPNYAKRKFQKTSPAAQLTSKFAYVFYTSLTKTCKHLGSQDAMKRKLFLDLSSWRA